MTRNPIKILENSYTIATSENKKDKGKSFFENLSSQQLRWIREIVSGIEDQKAVSEALITSLVKKIENPKQDIRFHKVELKGGYSARGYDTKYIMPFMKDKFRRFSMGESAWLTRSIEQPYPFTLDFGGKIRNRKMKDAFLRILDDLEENKTNPKYYLVTLFIMFIEKTSNYRATLITKVKMNNKHTISLIMNSLNSHFYHKYKCYGASRLPVIALYSIYEILMNNLERYRNKRLVPLGSHLSPDMRAKLIGDIQVMNKDGSFFEGVEIKYEKPITYGIVEDAYEKFRDKRVSRYLILTTAHPNIKSGEEAKINKMINDIIKEHDCEVILNGLMHTIRYYLRLIPNPSEFIENYTKNLQIEFSKSTEIKAIHLETWKKIVEAIFS